MEKDRDIDCIIDSIKIIEEHIESFKRKKPLFFQKKKLVEYNERIEKLEYIKNSLYKSLEYKVDNRIKSEQT